ncbi:unnamed protein product, partial [Mesorhabditis belari]|uniref:Uncharacterized protein n=1 Tax=Mesorhabditis belari TaxID=2138241 RepID=A0AAF3F942_9BILA
MSFQQPKRYSQTAARGKRAKGWTFPTIWLTRGNEPLEGNRTLDSIFKRRRGSNKKKAPVPPFSQESPIIGEQSCWLYSSYYIGIGRTAR